MQELRYSRLRVQVSAPSSPPSPHICQELVTALEAAIHSLSVSLYPQLVSEARVRCPCLASKVTIIITIITITVIITFQACSSHKIKSCPDPNCLHLLSLHECLASSTVWCGYFKVRASSSDCLVSLISSLIQVDTSFIRRHFPGDPDWCALDQVTRGAVQHEPRWLKGEAVRKS